MVKILINRRVILIIRIKILIFTSIWAGNQNFHQKNQNFNFELILIRNSAEPTRKEERKGDLAIKPSLKGKQGHS